MADDQKPQVATEEAPTWVKNPKTGEVLPLWKPEDLHAARANKFVDATPEEAQATHRQMQLEGWKGTAMAAGAGVASVIPFARNAVRRAAPQFGKDVDDSVAEHPWVHGAAELAAIAATAGIGGEGAVAGEVAEAAIPSLATAGAERALGAGAERLALGAGESAVAPVAERAALGAGEKVLQGEAVTSRGLRPLSSVARELPASTVEGEVVAPGAQRALPAETGGTPEAVRAPGTDTVNVPFAERVPLPGESAGGPLARRAETIHIGGPAEAVTQVDAKLAQTIEEAAGERGVASAVPSLSARLLGRLPDAAKNAQLGATYAAIDLTNEKDLPHSPEELASHIMGSLFWGAAGGVVGGELMHGLMKGASKVAEATGKAFAKGTEALDNMAAALSVGDGSAIIAKSKKALQGSFDAMDAMAKPKTIDQGMEEVRRKVGDAGMKDLDAQRIHAEEAYGDAKANVMRILGMNVTERGDTVRRISYDKVAKAMKGESREEVVDALKKLHEAGKQLHSFHETLAQAGATGLEGLGGKTKEQVAQLLEVQAAMKAGVAQAEAKKGIDEILSGGIGGAIASHFGHALLGKAYAGVKIGKALWSMAPAEFKAARLAQLARLSEGVDGHLQRVANAMHAGGVGKFAIPAASGMSFAELKKMREDVQQKLSNPQLAQDHLEQRAGVVNEFAPDTYGQMALQYGDQLQALAGILQWPQMDGPWAPEYMPSASEVHKMSTAVAIVKDPRVFEANLAKGTATPGQAAVYRQAHGQRAQALATTFAGGIKQGKKSDAGSLKAMTSAMILGITPRASYSQPMLQSTQGMYSMKATQQGGPGSRGGAGGAKALTASQMFTLPGQRVSNRPVK